MNLRSILCTLTICLSLASYAAHAVTCAANMTASNPDAAYTDHGDGTVTHIPTGLMWKRCSEGQSWNGSTCTGSASSYTWAQALTLGSTSSFAGQSDWRLPNLKELRSLVEECRVNPAINDTIFPATPGSDFWSGSPDANSSSYAWDVYFGNGYAYSSYRSYSYGVRLVRGGQSFDNLGVGGTAASVKFTSENLPDGSYQVGATTKTWRFSNGVTAITGLKAVPVSGKTTAGLGISAAEIVVGNVAANANFTVSLPLSPTHAGAAVKASYWKLVDGAGNPVSLSNSASGEFWLKLRTNRAPTFSLLQLDSLGLPVGQAGSLPLLATDGDGDALSFSVTGGGAVSGSIWSGSFGAAGVHPLALSVSDGIESASKTVYAVVSDAAGTAHFFSDVPFVDTSPNNLYAALQYLALTGVVIGYPDPNNASARVYRPEQIMSQAEALKVLMLTAQARSLVVLDAPERYLPNLIVNDVVNGVFENYTWAAPFILKADQLGMIDSAEAFIPGAPVTRAWLAHVMVRMLALIAPVDAITIPANYVFSDSAAFANAQDYTDARALAFFGYYGALGPTHAYGPASQMNRGEIAIVGAKIMRAPSMSGLTLQGTTNQSVGGRTLPAVTAGLNLNVAGIAGLTSHKILQIADLVKEDYLDPAENYVDATVVRVGQGIVAGGENVLAMDIPGAPVAVPTTPPDATGNEVRSLLLILFDRESGVRSVFNQDYAVLPPDRDGDGVPDNIDLWPDNPLFSADANGNGIPDNADDAFSLVARNGSDVVVVNGSATTIIQALTSGQFQGLAAAFAPAAPTIGVVTAGNASASVAFTPGAIGEGTLVNYTADCGGITNTGSGSPIVVSGLSNGTVYTCKAKTTSSVSDSPWSGASNSVTPVAPAVLPSAPTIGTATPGNTSASVAFTPGAIGSGTLVNYTADCGGHTNTGGVSPIVVTGLTNGVAYTCKVKTSSTAGISSWSGTVSVTPVAPAVMPNAPTIGTATPGNATASVAFTPGAIGSGTLVNYTADCGGITKTGSASPITVTGLTNGTTYTCKVKTTSTAGIGPWSAASNSVRPSPTVPGAPTIGTATAGNAQATVAFTPPASNGGSAITQYKATSTPGNLSASCTAPCTSIKFTRLSNGTAYTFRVTARNSIGVGAASSPSNSVTPATVPGAPKIGRATAGNASATVTFTAPASNGGAAIDGYTVTSTPAGGVDSNRVGQAGSTGLSHRITGLVNGTYYTFKVTAHNRVGTGAASWSSNRVKPSATAAAAASDGNAVSPYQPKNDFNGDGKSDILWHNASGATTAWLMNGAAMISAADLLADPGWNVAGSGDFDGDGKADILWRNPSDGTVDVWLMDGVSATSNTTLLADPLWDVAGTGDFDGDGKADILMRHQSDGTLSMLLMDGASTTATTTLLADPLRDVAGTGDFNGDGKADILMRRPSDGTVNIWLMDGATSTSTTTLLADPLWDVAGTGDFNGDGKADILMRHPSDGTVNMWLMDGAAVKSNTVLLATPAWQPVGMH